MSLSRALLDALLPPGSLWAPETDADFDLLLEGIGANSDVLVEYLESLARLRNPLLTPILADLETEYGIVPDPALDETIRRSRLLATKTAGDSDGSARFMEQKLREAGFDVYVHTNNPPIDPTSLLNFGSAAIFGTTDGFFNHSTAMFGQQSHIAMLVNGRVYDNQVLIGYDIPPEQYWPLIFFVGGEAVRNGAGELLTVAEASVDIRRRQELDTLIVRYKPLHSWCGPILRYVGA